MESKKISMFRRRLSSEHDKLVQLIIRARRAEEEVGMEKTEDEGDLATISQERDLLVLHSQGVRSAIRGPVRQESGDLSPRAPGSRSDSLTRQSANARLDVTLALIDHLP